MFLRWLWLRLTHWRKPAPPRDLSTVVAPRAAENIEETVRGAEILQSSHVETVELGALAKLPPFRPIVISLIRLFDRDDVEIDEISTLVRADPSMVSEILAVVNSPLFGFQTVSSPAHAIHLLGVERTKSVAATLAMRSLMQGGPRTPVVRRFWVHSIATATMARHFAPSFGVEPELSHVVALMHDLGRNGLLAAHQEAYARLALAAHGSTAEILAAEQAEFGMTHCQAGALLAKAWSLPAPFQQVAGHHHDETSEIPIVALSQLCCRLADDFMYQSIHRADIQKPEETISQCVPAHLRRRLIDQLTTVSAAVDAAIKALDF